ncbi:MAG: hypothetical protein Kow0068_12850 [Marinilabiliales bacterium]
MIKINFDCIHFNGAIPCKPNKENDVQCDNCSFYSVPDKRILIIKLGAIGDVIRTTPLLVRFRKMYKNPHITWITHSPAVLPSDKINTILSFNPAGIMRVENREFDIAINLDKDEEACMLLSKVNAKEKYGFIWKDNHIDAATDKAQHKLITGLFDHISKKNTKNYLEEIFEICHLDFNKEPYLLNYNKVLAGKWEIIKQKAGNKHVVGLNTGCGARWKTRLWPDEYWIKLIDLLKKENLFPVLVGGPEEHEKNLMLAKKADIYYPGMYGLEEFIALASNLDIIVTQVTMMMHIAIGLKIPIVLMNNIFNKHEFELYGRGVIVEPETGCDCYFGNTCKRERNCMLDLYPETILDEVKNLKKKFY